MRLLANQLETLRAVDAAQRHYGGIGQAVWVDRWNIAPFAKCAPGCVGDRIKSLVKRGLVEMELKAFRWYRLTDQGRELLAASAGESTEAV